MGVPRPGRPDRDGSGKSPDRKGSLNPIERSLTRRQMIAAGAALGGSIVWSPPFSLAGAPQNVLQQVVSLRRRVADNASLSDTFQARLLGILGHAIANLRLGKTAAACVNL